MLREIATPHIGFSGTQDGITRVQRIEAHELLLMLWRLGARVLHHGLCIGADEQVHDLARRIGYAIHGHPGFRFGHPKRSARQCHWTEPVPSSRGNTPPPIQRNHVIVDVSCYMFFCPKTKAEVQRSGTWATIRYVQRKRRLFGSAVLPYTIINP